MDKKGISILCKDKSIESVFVGNKTHKNFGKKQKKNEWKRLKDRMKVYSSRQIRDYMVPEDTGLFVLPEQNYGEKGEELVIK